MSLSLANALAYYEKSQLAAVKSCRAFFFIADAEAQNKLECFVRLSLQAL
jgi:hypothetical protein